jgi:uncharacterized membrane protein SirB2
MWRFLHIASMFGAVTLGVGGILFRNAVVRSGDVAAIRQALAVERRLAHLVATPLFIAGVAFGFVTAVTIGFDLTAPWLVTAYVLTLLAADLPGCELRRGSDTTSLVLVEGQPRFLLESAEQGQVGRFSFLGSAGMLNV